MNTTNAFSSAFPRGGCLVAGILGVLVLVVFLLAGGGRWLLELSGFVPEADAIAVYEDFLFSFRGDRVCSFTLREPGSENVPKIYVKITGQKDGHRPIFLPEFPEALAEKILSYKTHDVQHRGGINYRASKTLVAVDEMTFVHGSLYDLYFRAPSRFLLSRSPEGPYLGIPCSKEELLRVFGPPKRWSGYRRFTP